MTSSLRYPLGIQSFIKLREENKTYIDKTDLIYNLVSRYNSVFLARPRRFGKSLLISTIKAFFEGRKELFENLNIFKLEKEWVNYPVIHLDFSGLNSFNQDSLNEIINFQFSELENEYNIKRGKTGLSSRFANLIRSIYRITGKRVVILIDEYDNPIINSLTNLELLEKNRELLKSLFINLKSQDEYIKFSMLTGVSRFSKTSIFSGMNNLTDITFYDNFATICGFTEEEIRGNLWEGIKEFGKKNSYNEEESLSKLKYYYDGYHFSINSKGIYNPYSLLNALDHKEIKPYWFISGTPEFLVNKLKENPISFTRLFSEEIEPMRLSDSDTVFSSPASLLFQTGYLTIKKFHKDVDKLQLGIPNEEVKNGLFQSLLKNYVGQDEEINADACDLMTDFLKRGEISEFMKVLKSFLASVPYDVIPKLSELYFQNVLYLIFTIKNISIYPESRNSYGRSDLVIRIDDYIYIFELKLDMSADKALEQIKQKGYSTPYLNSGKKIIEVGINFSSKTRNIESWTYSEIK